MAENENKEVDQVKRMALDKALGHAALHSTPRTTEEVVATATAFEAYLRS